MLSHEYQVVRNRYSWLLFTSEDEYDVIMPVPHVRVMSQINCGDVTMLIQKRPYLVAAAKSAIDFFCVIVSSEHKKSMK